MSTPWLRRAPPPPPDYGTPLYTKMSATCISQDLSWAEPAKKWEGVLEEMYFGTPEAVKKAEVVVPIAKADAIAAHGRLSSQVSCFCFTQFMILPRKHDKWNVVIILLSR